MILFAVTESRNPFSHIFTVRLSRRQKSHSCHSEVKFLDFVVSNEKHIAISSGVFVPTQIRPTSRNDGSNAERIDCFEDCRCDPLRIVENNATKPDIDRWWTFLQEAANLLWRIVFWRLAKEEATHI